MPGTGPKHCMYVYVQAVTYGWLAVICVHALHECAGHARTKRGPSCSRRQVCSLVRLVRGVCLQLHHSAGVKHVCFKCRKSRIPHAALDINMPRHKIAWHTQHNTTKIQMMAWEYKTLQGGTRAHILLSGNLACTKSPLKDAALVWTATISPGMKVGSTR
jgi:hypothetical protein